ncbi:vascular cell adhesion protein 1 isoform X2 [Pimephales promelas]|uniref:vascular cell adhesion protein 1 isoform X2 n=1 Tax=Pimephales promelas TaxID=90988 RepID=UPI0019559AEC|nr:vascular cell adhesion protein 1 isoform X2 [Pimephales promelas]
MCGVKCITFALWINIHSVITETNGFKVHLTPLKSVNHVGADLELTCRVNACPAFPQDPVLAKIKSLIANQTQTLNCTVHNVYPLERIVIEWLRGNETLYVDEPQIPYDSVQSHSYVYNYTPSVSDLGKNLSCKATLKNPEIGLEKTRISNAEYGPGTITISSKNPSVKLGGHLEITCHADGNPKPTIFWWKNETGPAQNKSQNEKLIINNASWSQAGWYHCGANNTVGSKHMSVKVIVLGPPNIPKIQLSHTGDPKEGENITILCSSDDESVDLTLYRQSQNAASGALNETVVLLNIPSVQITDGGIYICEAKNDFGTERSTINITVEAQLKEEKKPDLPIAILPAAILPAAGSVSLLTIAGLLIRYCRKKATSNSGDITLS